MLLQIVNNIASKLTYEANLNKITHYLSTKSSNNIKESQSRWGETSKFNKPRKNDYTHMSNFSLVLYFQEPGSMT